MNVTAAQSAAIHEADTAAAEERSISADQTARLIRGLVSEGMTTEEARDFLARTVRNSYRR
jgi:polyhydroxyalkanoate synthesis regulator phasin